MTDVGGKLVLGFVVIFVGSFVLVMIMSLAAAGGIPPVETGIALGITIGAVMIHRLTEAIREVGRR